MKKIKGLNDYFLAAALLQLTMYNVQLRSKDELARRHEGTAKDQKQMT